MVLNSSSCGLLDGLCCNLTFSCQDQENSGNLKQQLERLFAESLKVTVPDESDVAPIITPCKDLKHGDYQWYNKKKFYSVKLFLCSLRQWFHASDLSYLLWVFNISRSK